jgi:hypothetical protein
MQFYSTIPRDFFDFFGSRNKGTHRPIRVVGREQEKGNDKFGFPAGCSQIPVLDHQKVTNLNHSAEATPRKRRHIFPLFQLTLAVKRNT